MEGWSLVSVVCNRKRKEVASAVYLLCKASAIFCGKNHIAESHVEKMPRRVGLGWVMNLRSSSASDDLWLKLSASLAAFVDIQERCDT